MRQPTENGRKFDAPAAITPACARISSRMREWTFAVGTHTVSMVPPRVGAPTADGDNCTVEIVTSLASTPVGVSIIRPTVRTSSAELTSSAHAMATSAATRTEYTRRAPFELPRSPDFKSVVNWVRSNSSAGTNPKITVVTATTPRHKPSARTSTPASSSLGIWTGVKLMISGNAAKVAAMPAIAPATDSTKLSAINCVTSCRGAAPSATRTAISFSRVRARVSSSVATFSTPMTSSSATAPNSTISAGR